MQTAGWMGVAVSFLTFHMQLHRRGQSFSSLLAAHSFEQCIDAITCVDDVTYLSSCCKKGR